MAGSNVKVDTQKLRNTAKNFTDARTKIKSTTQAMMQAVGQLQGMKWSGDAATKYTAKFKGLEDEMQAIDRMINEHIQDLERMAALYESAENEIEGETSKLKTDIFK
jgi:WXG100 family type VII secretion target